MKRILVLLLISCSLLLGDGGVLVVQSHSKGLIISVFVSPAPPRVGSADFSVLVQHESDGSVVLDARPSLAFSLADRHVVVEPTHDAATNKLLYAATVQLPAPGTWKVGASVGSAEASGTLTVLPPSSPLSTYWPEFLIVPVAIGLYILNQRLTHARAKRPRARTGT